MTKLRKQSKNPLPKPNGFWRMMYVDPNADAIQPRWWHKFMFWKKWNYAQWKMRREYIKLKDLLNSSAGSINEKTK